MFLLVMIAGQQRPANKPLAASMPSSAPAGPRIVDFGEGIKINYIDRQVEVAGEVILREGPLELFAYAKAAAPKEHESIVLVRSKPERVFMALGLVGATPGKPLRWFYETETLRPASGDPVDVLVRYREGKRDRVVQAVEWMLDAGTRKPMQSTHWLFCGSERSETGEFAANMEGTLVTVVDFTTSLLSLPQQHSDADSELWLMANERAIPPLGTPVTILLRPKSTTVHVRLIGANEAEIDGQRMARKDVRAAVQHCTVGWVDRALVVIEVDRKADVQSTTMSEIELSRELQTLGIDSSRITVKNLNEPRKTEPPAVVSTSQPR